MAREVKHGGGASNSRILIAAPSYEWLPNGQFNEVSFVTATNASLAGVLSDTNGLVLYIMTPTELLSLTKTGTPGAYVWTSGSVPSPTDYSLSVSVGPGSWDLVFYNPSEIISSGVNFWSSVTETPT